MRVSPIFSEDFFSKPLFFEGEKIKVSNETMTLAPPETIWSRWKRFVYFTQDLHIENVYNKMLKIFDGMESVRTFNKNLRRATVNRSETEINCLIGNMDRLRKKIERSGQLSLLSQLILKIVNLFRAIFSKKPLVMKTYQFPESSRDENCSFSLPKTPSRRRLFRPSVSIPKEEIGTQTTFEDPPPPIFQDQPSLKRDLFNTFCSGFVALSLHPYFNFTEYISNQQNQLYSCYNPTNQTLSYFCTEILKKADELNHVDGGKELIAEVTDAMQLAISLHPVLLVGLTFSSWATIYFASKVSSMAYHYMFSQKLKEEAS